MTYISQFPHKISAFTNLQTKLTVVVSMYLCSILDSPYYSKRLLLLSLHFDMTRCITVLTREINRLIIGESVSHFPSLTIYRKVLFD